MAEQHFNVTQPEGVAFAVLAREVQRRLAAIPKGEVVTLDLVIGTRMVSSPVSGGFWDLPLTKAYLEKFPHLSFDTQGKKDEWRVSILKPAPGAEQSLMVQDLPQPGTDPEPTGEPEPPKQSKARAKAKPKAKAK